MKGIVEAVVLMVVLLCNTYMNERIDIARAKKNKDVYYLLHSEKLRGCEVIYEN